MPHADFISYQRSDEMRQGSVFSLTGSCFSSKIQFQAAHSGQNQNGGTVKDSLLREQLHQCGQVSKLLGENRIAGLLFRETVASNWSYDLGRAPEISILTLKLHSANSVKQKRRIYCSKVIKKFWYLGDTQIVRYMSYLVCIMCIWADFPVGRWRRWRWNSFQASDHCSKLCANICKCETTQCF